MLRQFTDWVGGGGGGGGGGRGGLVVCPEM